MPIREHPMTARGLPLKFLLKLLLALLLAPAPAWPAPLQNVPDNAVAANRVDIRDHGGHADAWRGAMHYGAIGTHVTIGSVQILNVTLSSAGGASATISPAFVAPTLEGQTPGEVSNASMTLTAPGVGPGGAVVHGDITASSASTGVITCGGCTFAAQSGTAVKLELYVRDQNGTASNAGASYGITTTAPLLDERGNAVGTVLRLPQPMFGHGNTTQAMTGLRFCIRAQSEQEWCGTATQDPADDGMTVHLVGLPGSPAALPAQGPNRLGANLMVYWAPVLFRPDDATACAGQPRSIELPLTGAGRNPTTGQLNPTEGRIAARADPFNVTLAAQVHTRVPANGIGGIDGEVTIGCDDWPAYQAAVRALYRRADPDQQAELYFPADSFMASAGGGGVNIMYPTVVIQCGEGTVFWRGLNQTFYHGAAACQGTRPIASFPDVKDVVPAVTLRHLATLPQGATAVLVTAGNSPMGPGTNSAGFISSRHTKLCEAFQRAYPDLVWKCIDRAFGGTQFWSLDPGGITNGIPVGSAAPAWYTDLSKSWLGYYIRNDAPDVLVIGFANQEGFDLHLSALLESIAYTQTPAWAAATGKNPDIGLMPWPWQPTHYLSQVGTNFAASFQRSFVKACNSSNTLLASKGCPFLIDVARMESIAADGTDPEELPMRRTYALPSAGGAITAFPWFYTTPRPGLLGTVEFAHAAPNPSAGRGRVVEPTFFSASDASDKGGSPIAISGDLQGSCSLSV